MHTLDKRYQILNQEAGQDPNIIGFFLGGSRGKGMANQYSDYDVVMIVRDEVSAEYRKKYEGYDGPDVELGIFSLSEFRNHAAWGSAMAWDRYNYAHLKVEIDKLNGDIQRLVDEKGRVPPEVVRDYIIGSIDAYVNRVYRSVKCIRNGNELGARLQALESIPSLLDAFFALHGGRIKPYYEYLSFELTQHPLTKLPSNADQLVAILLTVMEKADLREQQKLLAEVEQVFRGEGFNQVFDDWGEKLPWMKSFSL